MSTPTPSGPREGLLARILDVPALERIVPQLDASVLQRVIERCGLEDCGPLMALATPAQLAGVLDIDLWHPDRPGRDDAFDADRFGAWLNVLVETDVDVAAHLLSALAPSLVVAGLSRHVRVFDLAAATPSSDADEDHAVDGGGGGGTIDLSCTIGGYLVIARRAEAWDAIATVLPVLAAEYAGAFHRMLAGCRGVSNSTPETDGLDVLLDAPAQLHFDLDAEREHRRERQGFARPAEARAFLELARHTGGAGAAAGTLRQMAAPFMPAAHADDRAAAPQPPASSGAARSAQAAEDETAPAQASLVELLADAGIILDPARALAAPPAGRAPTELEEALRTIAHLDDLLYLRRTQELAFLANALIAGAPLQGRAFTPAEASAAAAATCNLGLQYLDVPQQTEAPSDRPKAASPALSTAVLAHHDLLELFASGWQALYRNVTMHVTARLIGVLAGLRCSDRQTQAGVNSLRRELSRHARAGTPWRARDALDVLTALDLPCWAALLGLIAEVPVLHAGLTTPRDRRLLNVDPAAFSFISERGDVATAQQYLTALPEILRG